MRLADFRDNRLGGHARIGRLGHRAADDKIVGAVADGLGRRGDAFLVADGSARRPYAGGDKKQARADGLARHGRFRGARHQPVDAKLKRLFGSPPDGLDHAEAVDRVEKIGVVVGGQAP